MKQKELQMVLLRSLVSVATATAGSMALVFLLKRFLTPKTSDADMKSALRKLQEIESLRGRPPKEIILNDYECEIVKDVVSPADIDVDFNSIGSLEDIKKSIREVLLLPINRPELFEGRNSKLLAPPKGILLYGPPGTGKTMMAKAIAKEGKLAFININLSTILSKWYGESEKIVRSIFTLAHKLQPCVVFFDELDCFFGGSHSSTSHSYQMQVESVFMTLWDGIVTDNSSRVIVIGATNRPYNLSPAILRRMPLQFLFDLPNQAQRAQILEVVLANEPLAPGFSIETLAKITSGYSGSDLHELCKKAAVAPLRHFLAEEEARKARSHGDQEEEEGEHGLRPMQMEDFVEAMKEVAPTGKKAKQYHNFARKRGNGEEEEEENASGGISINMADIFNLWSTMMNRSQAPPPSYSSSSSSSSTETTREGKKLPKIEEIIDEGIEELEEQDDERIEKWSKRFEGEEGTKLLHQLCDLVDVDISQPRPVVLRQLAKHFLD